MLSEVCLRPGYLVWWQIADSDHTVMWDCEVMAKIVSHASILKVDDVLLKGHLSIARFCGLCDLTAEDDLRHFVRQCPSIDRTLSLTTAWVRIPVWAIEKVARDLG